MTTRIEDRLAVNKYDVDSESHIELASEICGSCEARPCVFVCPAGCFKASGARITLSYEGCLECGSCRIVCDKSAIRWRYPRAGFGICYEFG